MVEGASLGALNLHNGLIESGVNSIVLSNAKYGVGSNDIIQRSYVRDRIIKGVGNLPLRFYAHRSNGPFNTGFGHHNISKYISRLGIDILHVHWANGMIGVSELTSIQLPTVITMRDMWYFTGGCHYTMECKNFKSICTACPHLGNNHETLITKLIQKKKKKLIDKKNVSVVAISRWLQTTAGQSKVMANKNIHYIPNSVDIENFSIFEKLKARRLLNIPQNNKIILIGAQSIYSRYKGSDLLPAIFDKLDRSIQDAHILSFGKHSLRYTFKHNTYQHIGYVHDRKKMNLLYSAADVFMMTSVIEAFGKTIVESLASGTPVCVFDNTGGTDLVAHKENGFVAKSNDVDDMINGILYILNNIQNISAHTNKLEKEYGSFSTAQKYLNLYEEISNANYDS